MGETNKTLDSQISPQDIDTRLAPSEIIPEDIDPERLAGELGLDNYYLPDTYYQQAGAMLEEFYQELGKKTIEKGPEELGDFLMEHIDEIMQIFEKYPDMWRFPLCLQSDDVYERITKPLIQGVAFRKNTSISDEKLSDTILQQMRESPIPIDAPDDAITTYISHAIDNTFLMISFALFVFRGRKFEFLTEKYGKRIEGKETRESHIADESQYQIETAWASRYLTLMKRILGKDNFAKFIPDIKNGAIEIDKIGAYHRETKRYWRNNLTYERVLIHNPASEEDPTRDLEGLNFFLCQTHLYGYEPLVIGITRDSVAHTENWKVWIKEYIEKIADSHSEINKVFRYIFTLVGEVFEGETLSPEARKNIPTALHQTLEKSLEKYHRKLSPKTPEKQVRATVNALIDGAVKSTIEPTKIPLTGIQWSQTDNTLLFTQGLPSGTKKIEIRIYNNNGKVAGFGIYEGAMKESLGLETDTFSNQNINAHKPLKLGQPLEYTPGEKYQIGITTYSDKGKSEEFKTEYFVIPKEKKESSDLTLPHMPRTRGKVGTIMAHSTPQKVQSPTPTIAPVEIAKDPKVSEKEDLQTALEFFLEKPDQELLSFFQEHTQWDPDTQTLTLNVPIKELAEMGYVPNKLTEETYAPLLRWISKQEKGEWILPEGTPDKIRDIMSVIQNNLLAKEEKEKENSRVQEIDTKLSQLGLQPSRRSTDVLQRLFTNICKKKTVNFARLDAKMVSLGIREQGYRFFHNGSNSITLAKKQGESKNNEWSINYNWGTDRFHIVGLEKNDIFQERLKNALVRFLVRLDEEMVDEMLLGNVRTFNKNKVGKLDLEAGLKERLQGGEASIFIRQYGQDIMIPDISGSNYETKIAEIYEKYGKKILCFIVYRTYSYALSDEQYKKGQDEVYNQCIENHLDMMQARCRATLAQKAHCKENNSNGDTTVQERGPFTNGVADHCREFFFKKDPNDLDDVADFMAFLQEKGTNQNERPGEKPVGIVYNSPVIGPISDIPRILAKETKKKPKKSTIS